MDGWMDGWGMDEWTDGQWMDGRTDGRMDGGWMDEWMDGWMDEQGVMRGRWRSHAGDDEENMLSPKTAIH